VHELSDLANKLLAAETDWQEAASTDVQALSDLLVGARWLN